MTNSLAVASFTMLGTVAEIAEIRCVVDPAGSPSFEIVDLSASGYFSVAAARESSVRIRSALAAIGRGAPNDKTAIQVSTQSSGTSGTAALDLALALAVLVADGVVPGVALDGLLVAGELGLDGSIRPVRGVLAAALRARAAGMRGVLVPEACAWEAALVDGIAVHPVGDLAEAVAALRGDAVLRAAPPAAPARSAAVGPPLDMSEVRGRAGEVEAIARAVLGGRGVLIVGPPSSSRTMIARRVSSLLPALTRAEAIEVTLAYSAIGLATGLVDARPFRAPHHTISAAGLAGEELGRRRRPGEVHLAVRGVLFLDELAEFSRASIAALAGALGRMTPEARPVVVASASPCPCGWAGSEVRTCACGDAAVGRHLARLSAIVELLGGLGGIARVDVAAASLAEMRDAQPGESSASLRVRFGAAAAAAPEADVTPAMLTREMVAALRESLRDGTPLTADHGLFTICTNTLAAFGESAWNPAVWTERYFTSPDHRVRICDEINARARARGGS